MTPPSVTALKLGDPHARMPVDAQPVWSHAADQPHQSLKFSQRDFLFDVFAQSTGDKRLPFFVSALLHSDPINDRLICPEPNPILRERKEEIFSVPGLFNVSGTASLPQTICYLHTRDNEGIAILKQEICLSATNSVKIVSTSVNDADTETQTEPQPILLNWSLHRSEDREEARVPFTWKDLRFQVLPDNSKTCRTGFARRFSILLQVVATLFGDKKIIIAQVNTGSMVIQDTGIQGSAPRNVIWRSLHAPCSEANRDDSPNALSAGSSPTKDVYPTVQNSALSIASFKRRQKMHTKKTTVPTRAPKWHPYSSRASSGVGRQPQPPFPPPSHPLRITSSAVGS